MALFPCSTWPVEGFFANMCRRTMVSPSWEWLCVSVPFKSWLGSQLARFNKPGMLLVRMQSLLWQRKSWACGPPFAILPKLLATWMLGHGSKSTRRSMRKQIPWPAKWCCRLDGSLTTTTCTVGSALRKCWAIWMGSMLPNKHFSKHGDVNLSSCWPPLAPHAVHVFLCTWSWILHMLWHQCFMFPSWSPCPRNASMLSLPHAPVCLWPAKCASSCRAWLHPHLGSILKCLMLWSFVLGGIMLSKQASAWLTNVSWSRHVGQTMPSGSSNWSSGPRNKTQAFLVNVLSVSGDWITQGTCKWTRWTKQRPICRASTACGLASLHLELSLAWHV